MERRKKLEEATKRRYTVVKEVRDPNVKGRTIGIDLGTTNSCLCYIDRQNGKPKIIPSPTGSWVFPTAVTFDKNHTIRMYGEEARASVRSSASATLCSGKRLIGRGFGELGKVQSDLQKTNILTVNEQGQVAVEVMGRTYTVLHIIAMFLRYLKNEAEAYLKEPVDQVVVSVPAYFTPQQKVATEDAALSAGFDVLEIIDEPSATCLAHTVLSGMLDKDVSKGKRKTRSFVFDLGGGTLDCAVMEHDKRRGLFRLVATHGDPMLGGNDWDTVISDYFAREFESKWKIPIEEEDGNVGQGVAAFRNLLLEAEKAKIHFTNSTDTYYGYNRAFHFSTKLREIIPLEVELTHEKYVELTRPLRVRCVECIEQLFVHTKLNPEDIDNILLVGAMTRDPPIRHMMEEYFQKPVESAEVCPADYAVAIGAGVRAGMLQGEFKELTQRTRFVSGTVQSQRQKGFLRRTLANVKQAFSYSNPNAIGLRWRGRVRGLSEEEISNYAKELVEFEAACARRVLLERVENEANAVMRRMTADSNRKQGSQEKRIVQLGEQVKFWQYMVHNFHDHEEELERTVSELREALDELEGLSNDHSTCLTSEGTIDFAKVAHQAVNRSLGRAENAASPENNPEPVASKKVEKTESDDVVVPKVLRRKAPLPEGSAAGQELLESGHSALLHADIPVQENTRKFFMEAQVNDRVWREPPSPPGESGSWAEVKEAMDRGEPLGSPLPIEDFERPMTMEEMYERLQELCPIDDPPSEQHAARREHARMARSMHVIENSVDMIRVQLELDAESGVLKKETETEPVEKLNLATECIREANA